MLQRNLRKLNKYKPNQRQDHGKPKENIITGIADGTFPQSPFPPNPVVQPTNSVANTSIVINKPLSPILSHMKT